MMIFHATRSFRESSWDTFKRKLNEYCDSQIFLNNLPAFRVKEAGKVFLLHACAQSTHARTNMHASENIAMVHV